MIWQDRTRTDPTKRKFIDENGNEQNVNIEEIQSNITQSGTPVNATTMNNIEKNLGTYGNDSYDSTATYLEGETVTHNALLYRAKQDIDTAEEWNEAHWEETSALGELSRTSGNEIAYGLDNITRQSKAVVYPTNYRTVNQEVNIGATNPSNIKTWFKKSKNLWNFNTVNTNYYGVTSTYNNSTLTLNGTATAETSNIAHTNMVYLLPGTYTFRMIKESGSATGSQALIFKNYTTNTNILNTTLNLSSGNTITFTLQNDAWVSLTIYFFVSNVFTNLKLDIQIEKGSAATTYEPYIAPSIIADNTEFYSQDNYEQYSLGEIRIGTWINGKPLYRKVVDYYPTEIIGAGGTTTNIQVPHNISNFRQIINCRVVTETNHVFPTLASSTGSTLTAGNAIIQVNSTNIIFRIINDSWSSRHFYFILEYTKTTD